MNMWHMACTGSHNKEVFTKNIETTRSLQHAVSRQDEENIVTVRAELCLRVHDMLLS